MLLSSIVGADRRIISAEFDEHAASPEILEGAFGFGRVVRNLLRDRERRCGPEQANRFPRALMHCWPSPGGSSFSR